MSEEPKQNGEKREDRNDKGQFVKGNPGGGRPLGSLSVTEQIKKELAKYVGEGENRKTYLELLTKRIIREAVIEGNGRMIKSIWAYVDGLPKQNLELDIPNALTEIQITIVKTKEDIKKANEHNETTKHSSVSEKSGAVSEEGEEGSN